MRHFLALAWLAARLAVTRESRWTTLVLGCGTILLCLAGLATISIPRAMNAQASREDDLSPRVSQVSRPDQSRLLTIDPSVSDSRRWDGHEIKRTLYSRGKSELAAPGVRTMPAVGEYAASPALVELIRTSATVGAMYDGRRLTEVIDDSGLVSPVELRSVEGVPPSVPLLVEVAGFGGIEHQHSNATEDRTRLNRLIAWIVFAAVWLPAAAFLTIITRLSSTARVQSARSLRLLGTSRTATLAATSMGTAMVCVPATVAGCLLFDFISGRVNHVPGTSFGFFTDDVRLPLWVYVVTSAVLVAWTASSAATSLARRVKRPQEMSESAPAPASRSGLVILCAGVILLVSMPVLVQVLANAVGFALWTGVALVALGFAMSGPTLVQMVAARLAPLLRSGAALVGTRLAASGRTSLRLGSIVGVCTVLFLGSLAFMTILQGGSAEGWGARLSRQPLVPVVVNDLSGQLTVNSARRATPGGHVVQLVETREHIGVVIGGCADLSAVSASSVNGCTDQPAWITRDGLAGRSTLPQRSVHLPDGRTVPIPGPGDQVRAENIPAEFDGALFVPDRFAASEPTSSSSYFFLVTPNDELTTAMAHLTGLAPLVQFDLGALDFHNPSTQQYPVQLACLVAGSALGLTIGALAVLAAILGESRARSARLRGMRILGASPAQVLLAHVLASAAAPAGLGAMSLLLGWITATAITHIDGRAYISGRTYLVVAVVVAVVGMGVALATWPDARRRSANMAGVDA